MNVDKYGEPDLVHDLETFPWPWASDSVDEITLCHVLEHLGRDPDVFIGVMKEIYRVCKGGAEVVVKVPHPRSDDFINDPTHVRAVTPEMLCLFSRQWNDQWIAEGSANTPLAVYHNVNFEVKEAQVVLCEKWSRLFDQREINMDGITEAARNYNNVIREYCLTLKVLK